jgi:hypothetical protein
LKYSEAFRSTQGQAPQGFRVVKEIKDETRHVTAYVSTLSVMPQEMVIGFDCTLGAVFSLKNRFFLSADWWQNLMAWPMELSVGTEEYLVHDGFLREYRTFRAEVMNWIDIYRPSLIRVPGFSQGEAHSVLTTRDALHNFKAMEIHGVGFGGPRLYEGRAAHEFTQALAQAPVPCSYTQIRQWGDPVPHSVPALAGYRHVGKVQYVGHYRFGFHPSVHNGDAYIKALESAE